jgi:AAA domain
MTERSYCDEALAAAGIANSGGGGLIVHRASDITPEPVEWLWPGRVAIGKQTLIAGEAGLGKSQVTIDMATQVSNGGEWPCGEGVAPLGNVFILSAEDGAADTVIPRLMAAGADRERVHLVRAVRADDGKGQRAFNLQADLDLLAAEIKRIGEGRLVIIDPISSYLGPKVDSHVNAAVRGILEPVGEMAERCASPSSASRIRPRAPAPPRSTGSSARSPSWRQRAPRSWSPRMPRTRTGGCSSRSRTISRRSARASPSAWSRGSSAIPVRASWPRR